MLVVATPDLPTVAAIMGAIMEEAVITEEGVPMPASTTSLCIRAQVPLHRQPHHRLLHPWPHQRSLHGINPPTGTLRHHPMEHQHPIPLDNRRLLLTDNRHMDSPQLLRTDNLQLLRTDNLQRLIPLGHHHHRSNRPPILSGHHRRSSNNMDSNNNMEEARP